MELLVTKISIRNRSEKQTIAFLSLMCNNVSKTVCKVRFCFFYTHTSVQFPLSMGFPAQQEGVLMAVGRWAGKAQQSIPLPGGDFNDSHWFFAVKQEFLLPKQYNLRPHFINISLQICVWPWDRGKLPLWQGFSMGFVVRGMEKLLPVF